MFVGRSILFLLGLLIGYDKVALYCTKLLRLVLVILLGYFYSFLRD